MNILNKKEIKEKDIKSIEILLSIIDNTSIHMPHTIIRQAADAKISIENIKNNIKNKSND